MTAPTGRRSAVAGIALALLALPVALALVEAVSFSVRNRPSGTLRSSGLPREYSLHVPASYHPDRPTPLVISLHGAGLWGAAQREISRWNQIAEREGLIVVYPSGIGAGSPRIWNMKGPDRSKDVRFISDLIDTLAAGYSIDRTRIYADGLSNGGGMAFILSCALSDRIAAVGMVASAQLLPFTWCTSRVPVPMIAFHGTADSVTPYHGGKTWIGPDPFHSIPVFTASWARRNGCAGEPTESVIAADVVRLEYPGCAETAAVVLYRIEGGGHSWPGGGPVPAWLVGRTSHSVEATNVMWEFFRRHPLVTRRASRE